MAGLSIRKGSIKGEWSVYKYNTLLFKGIQSRQMALNIIRMLTKKERQLRK